MIDAVTATTLIPGSVWTRAGRNGEEIAVTVLLITNGSVPDKVLLTHPQQVVFLTKKRNVQSMTLNDFVSTRSYSTMDKQAETLLEALLAEDLEEDAEEIDIDSIPLPDELRSLVGAEADVADQVQQEAGFEPDNAFQIAPDHPLASQMSRSFRSYTESAERSDPNYLGDTLVTLRFQLDEHVTIGALRAVFGSGNADLEIDTFNINSPIGATKVDIATFISVFLEVVAARDQVQGATVAVVQLISSGDLRASSEEVEFDDQAPAADGEVMVDLSAAPGAPIASQAQAPTLNVVAG